MSNVNDNNDNNGSITWDDDVAMEDAARDLKEVPATHEVRDSMFFLSLIPCVICVKCGRVFYLLSKVYVLFCLLFSVMFGFCFFAVYTSGTL